MQSVPLRGNRRLTLALLGDIVEGSPDALSCLAQGVSLRLRPDVLLQQDEAEIVSSPSCVDKPLGCYNSNNLKNSVAFAAGEYAAERLS